MPKVRAMLTISFEAEDKDEAVTTATRISDAAPKRTLYALDILNTITADTIEAAGRLGGIAMRRCLFPETNPQPIVDLPVEEDSDDN